MSYFDEEYYDDINEFYGGDDDYYPDEDEWPPYADYNTSLESEMTQEE